MQMTATDGVVTAVFELNDSPAAWTLAAQLPLSLKVEPFGSNERIFYPPLPLDTAGALAITSARAGTLAYYAPWKNAVMFCGDFSGGRDDALFELGRAVKGADAIRRLRGTIALTAKREGTA